MSPGAESPLLAKTLESLERVRREGPSWLGDRRGRAADALRSSGLPHNRLEDWRFSSLRPVKALPFEPSPGPPALPKGLIERGVPEGAAAVVVAGGHVQLDAARRVGAASVRRLRDALDTSPGLVEEHLLRLSAPSDGFAAQNAALFEDAVVVHVPADARVEEPVFIVHAVASTDVPTAAYPRVLIVAEPSSAVQIVEVFVSAGGAPRLSSAVSEVVVLGNAQVEHTRIHLGAETDYIVGSIEVEQHRDARYTSRVFTLGGALCRLDLRAQLVGQGAECRLDGLYLAARGDNVDHHTRVEHQVGRATSHQVYKGVLDAGGNAVFDGTVVVARGADGTDAHQKNENLLLAEDATVHTKPHLEIDTDDVTCSHGTTVGRLDENQVFYLQSRGIDQATARAVLVDAFAREMIDRVPNEALRNRIAALVLERAPAGDLARRLS